MSTKDINIDDYAAIIIPVGYAPYHMRRNKGILDPD
jgi:hypothetical protein